jgi:hypothetical protein
MRSLAEIISIMPRVANKRSSGNSKRVPTWMLPTSLAGKGPSNCWKAESVCRISTSDQGRRL